MNPADEIAASAGSGEKSDQQLRAILDNLQRVNPVEHDDFRSGIADRETSERRAIYDRLVAIEKEMRRRGRRGFARYLVAILIGVAATLAWQSYSDAAKQGIATSATELGWSPEAKQMIAGWVQQLGWAKPPAVAQTAPTAPTLDPEQMQQMATLRQAVEQIAAGQDQMKREIVKMQSTLIDVLVKMPQPPAAPAHKPTPAPPPAPPSSRAPVPPQHP